VLKTSDVYETLPYGKKEQPDFLNAVISLDTDKDPLRLFQYIKDAEKQVGRTPSEKWGEREIDIDILFYEDEIIDNDTLTIPHKGIAYRDFVLKPLADIAPDFIHPQLNKSVTELLNEVTEKNIIRIFPGKIF
jgi:2-amino-4-hydroxy-6-hydroxymethyldihydropteridine diphosphokinase